MERSFLNKDDTHIPIKHEDKRFSVTEQNFVNKETQDNESDHCFSDTFSFVIFFLIIFA